MYAQRTELIELINGEDRFIDDRTSDTAGRSVACTRGVTLKKCATPKKQRILLDLFYSARAIPEMNGRFGEGKTTQSRKKNESRAATCTLLACYIQSIAPISEKTILNKPHLRAVTGAADDAHADAPVPQPP